MFPLQLTRPGPLTLSSSLGNLREEKDEVVTISVGLLEWKETDMKLKPVRGKRIANSTQKKKKKKKNICWSTKMATSPISSRNCQIFQPSKVS